MRTIGRYEILKGIATGGMAEVYLARTQGEGGFEKLVAIKQVLPHLTTNKTFIKMFMDEARISATLTHSNIAQIFEFGKVDDAYFIAMEFIDGLSLSTMYRAFRKKRSLPQPAMVAFLLANICAALEYAHSRCDAFNRPLNIIHRDVSPSNILVSFNGEVKLIDFGVAKASHRIHHTVGVGLKGKYAYMSPEQAFGKRIDHRSDIFSAGILLFELLSGTNPFRGKNDMQTLEKVRKAEVPLPNLTFIDDAIPLLDIALRALARKPEERYQSAGEMQEDLEKFFQKHGYGSRQLARFMNEEFTEEKLKQQAILQRVQRQQERPRPKRGPLQTAPKSPAPFTLESDNPSPLHPKSNGAANAPLAPAPSAPLEDGAPKASKDDLSTQPTAEFSRAQTRRRPTPLQEGVTTDDKMNVITDGEVNVFTDGKKNEITDGEEMDEFPTYEMAPKVMSKAPSGPNAAPPPSPPPPHVEVIPLGPATGTLSGKVAVPVDQDSRSTAEQETSLEENLLGQLLPATATLPKPRPFRPHGHGNTLMTRKRSRIGLVLSLVTIALLLSFFIGWWMLDELRQQPVPNLPMGSVSLTIVPPVHAQIFVDHELHGAMNAGETYLIDNLLQGKHHITIKGRRFKQVETTVDIRQGQSTPLKITVETQ